MIQFVIPAAGNAARFGGVLKELLPVSEIDCGLSHSVRLAMKLGECDPVIVTTADKLHWHVDAIASRNLSAKFVVKPNPAEGDMWGSVLMGIDPTMDGGIILPDTYALVSSMPAQQPITFGCFVTRTPWQFSCLDLASSRSPCILTKQQRQASMLAWGMVTWARDSAAQLMACPDHFDRAFESVMRDRGYGIFMLDSYIDFGSYASYREFLHERRVTDHVP